MSDYFVGEELGKELAGQTVLHGVGFALARGECLALLGETGCGKTTLLNLLAGFSRPERGRILCEGRVLSGDGAHVPAAERGFAMVFRETGLWPHLTVEQNVAFGLRFRKIRVEEQKKRGRQMLERLGVADLAAARPADLNTEQQVRVALARAMVVEPRLLLFDEPLGDLPASLRQTLRHEVATLLHELNLTAIYATSSQNEALALGHRVAVMRQGHLEQIDSPVEIYRQPATLYVAKFLGAANELPLHWSGKAPATARPEGLSSVVRREEVRVRLVGEALERQVAEGMVRLPGLCQACYFAGERFEVEVLLEDDHVLHGFAPEALPVGRRVAVEFPRAAVREVPS